MTLNAIHANTLSRSNNTSDMSKRSRGYWLDQTFRAAYIGHPDRSVPYGLQAADLDKFDDRPRSTQRSVRVGIVGISEARLLDE